MVHKGSDGWRLELTDMGVARAVVVVCKKQLVECLLVDRPDQPSGHAASTWVVGSPERPGGPGGAAASSTLPARAIGPSSMHRR